MRRSIMACGVFALCGLGLLGCAAVLNTLEQATTEGSVAGKAVRGLNRIRKSQQDLDPSEEHFIGRSVAAAVLALPDYKLATSPKLNDYLNKIGNGIVASSDAARHTFNGYQFAVLESKEINAFACPGGTVFVTRGLIEKTQSEDELAGVIAHEIAHVTLRHGLAAIKKSNLVEGFKYLGEGAAQATLSDQDLKTVANIFGDSIKDIVTTMVKNGYAKECEYESDKLGEQLAAAAGYEPNALRRVIERMKDGAGGHGGMLSTHPAPQDRLQHLGQPVAWSPDPEGVQVRTQRYREALQ